MSRFKPVKTSSESRRNRSRRVWEYPVGQGAVGRIYDISHKLLHTIADPVLYRNTGEAVHAYLKDAAYLPDMPVDEDVYARICREIDLSLHRSAMARQRAEARKKPTGPTVTISEPAPATDTVSDTVSDTASGTTLTETSPGSSCAMVRPTPRRDPDVIFCRTPRQPAHIPRYRVTDG